MEGSETPLQYFDPIHTGDPAKHADVYLNHHAVSVSTLHYEGDLLGNKVGQKIVTKRTKGIVSIR